MRKNISFIALGAGLAISGIALSGRIIPPAIGAPERPNTRTESPTMDQLRLFGAVMERVKAQYVEPVDDKKLIEAAINGMLTSLDPHSSFLNNEGRADMKEMTKGEFGGLGIEVTMEEGLVKVVSPIDDTPAARAGLQSGDLITHIDDKPIMGMLLSDAVDKMRGLKGTKIKLTVRRGGVQGEPFDVTLTRDVIKVKSVKFEVKKNNVGYIRIASFTEQTQPGLEEAIASIKAKTGDKLVGYVLDLRNNPGGLLNQGISVSDSFLDSGEIVSTRSRDPNDGQRWNAEKGDLTNGKPIVVLINGGSASAAEIVSGALQDHKRAILMGTKSFGKGSVQTIMDLPGGVAMRLTTARYYTPSGRSIQAKGIEPDIEVKPAKIEELAALSGISTSEADLPGALNNDQDPEAVKKRQEETEKLLHEKESAAPTDNSPEKTDKTAKPTDKDAKPVDYQLERAIDLLEGLTLFQANTTPMATPDKTSNTANP